LTNSDAEFLAELGQKRKAFGATQEALASLRARARSSEELLKQDRAVSAILDAKKKGALSGIFGTVAQLGHVDERFSTALQVAAGSRMRNIVVESPDVAIKCLNLLKESKVGIATFLPLTALRVPVIGDALLRLVDERDVLGLAANLVDCDGRFNPVFKHVFGDTLIVRDVGTARKLGVGKYRMVTLDGDLFERSGAISGGFRRKGVGLAFEVKELLGRVSAQAGAVLQLKKEIEDLESQRAQIAAQLMELREQKAALEGKIESLKELKLEPLEALQKERVGLGAERNELQKSLKEVVEQNKWIAKQIESKSAKLRSDRAKIKDLQFGEQKDQLDGIAQRRLEIDSSLAALGASLENALVPDQENIERVIRELGKEKKKFEEQIEGEQGRIKKLQRELDAKEQDEKKLYGCLTDVCEQGQAG